MPSDLLVRRIGRSLLPANAAAEEAFGRIPQNVIVRADVRQPRRPKNHRHFFWILSLACHHWPHGHEPEPDGNTELLRAWLLAQTTARQTVDFPVTHHGAVITLLDRSKRRGEYAFVRQGSATNRETGEIEPTLRVFMPPTINWDEMDEATFAPTKQEAFAIIERVIGCTISDLETMGKEAA